MSFEAIKPSSDDFDDTEGDGAASPHTITSINQLDHEDKRAIYMRMIPVELRERFNLNENLIDQEGNDLLKLNCPAGSSVAEMSLYHQNGFQDPILYGQISDTINGQLHVLLYILNDPDSPRFDIDRMPDGTKTKFGTTTRNLEAELAAMQFGLAPGHLLHDLRVGLYRQLP